MRKYITVSPRFVIYVAILGLLAVTSGLLPMSYVALGIAIGSFRLNEKK